jgi:hypothetical protein
MTRRISDGIQTALRHGEALVKIFLTRPDDFGTGFAGITFDGLDPNETNCWGVADLLAVTLLDVGVRPKGVRRILESNDNRFNDLLSSIDPTVDLWSDDEDRVKRSLDVAEILYKDLKNLGGVGPVTASKLLARKRPRLIPISDSVIQRALGLNPSDPFWEPLRTALGQNGVLDAIRKMRPSGYEQLSELRVLDIAIWMLNSNSRAARIARIKVGAPAHP